MLVIEKIANSFASKYNLDPQELNSYLLEKYILIQDNYESKEEKPPWELYLKKSLRGYCKNYVRDVVMPRSIPRRHLSDWVSQNKMKREGFSNEIIEQVLGVSTEILESRGQTIKEIRYGHSELKPWCQPQNTSNPNAVYKLEMMIDQGMTPEQVCEYANNDIDLVDLVSDYCG